MNCSTCQPLLSAHVDDAMRADERAAVDEHLRGCAACRALAQDLSSISLAAGSLEPLVPAADVWHRIAAAAETQTQARGFRVGWFSWRPVAAVAMAAVLAAGLWRVGALLHPAGNGTSVPQVAEVITMESDPEAHYTLAIARLEEVTHADQDVLDHETAGALNAGLTVIDEAITESRAALRSEPQSESAQESLFAALRRKVAVLQEMLALINEMREADQQGAARILSEINR